MLCCWSTSVVCFDFMLKILLVLIATLCDFQLLSARDMARRTVISSDRLVYSTEKDVSDQDLEAREWDRRFRELERSDWWYLLPLTSSKYSRRCCWHGLCPSGTVGELVAFWRKQSCLLTPLWKISILPNAEISEQQSYCTSIICTLNITVISTNRCWVSDTGAGLQGTALENT